MWVFHCVPRRSSGSARTDDDHQVREGGEEDRLISGSSSFRDLSTRGRCHVEGGWWTVKGAGGEGKSIFSVHTQWTDKSNDLIRKETNFNFWGLKLSNEVKSSRRSSSSASHTASLGSSSFSLIYGNRCD